MTSLKDFTISPAAFNVAAHIAHPSRTPRQQRNARRQVTEMLAELNPWASATEVADAVRAMAWL